MLVNTVTDCAPGGVAPVCEKDKDVGLTPNVVPAPPVTFIGIVIPIIPGLFVVTLIAPVVASEFTLTRIVSGVKPGPFGALMTCQLMFGDVDVIAIRTA